MTPTRPPRPPQLLIASHNHGPGLELLQLAERRGYRVRRAHTGAQALEQAHAAPPDLVVLDESLTDMDAFAASRALRDDPHVGAGTPLLLISTQRPSSPQHHAALRAGVWEFLRHPFHDEEIAAKLDTYVLLKFDSDRARRDASIADAGGFYNVRGPPIVTGRENPGGAARARGSHPNSLVSRGRRASERTHDRFG